MSCYVYYIMKKVSFLSKYLSLIDKSTVFVLREVFYSSKDRLIFLLEIKEILLSRIEEILVFRRTKILQTRLKTQIVIGSEVLKSKGKNFILNN